MTFLYVGLGIAMISGISAMLQLGNNINNFTLVSTLKNNEYYQSLLLPSQDRKIIEFLNSYSGPDNDVCLEVKKELNNTLVESVYEGKEEGISLTPSKNEFLINSLNKKFYEEFGTLIEHLINHFYFLDFLFYLNHIINLQYYFY